ncbi:MAG: acyltransferase family protein [Terrimesophilobacter sp.]
MATKTPPPETKGVAVKGAAVKGKPAPAPAKPTRAVAKFKPMPVAPPARFSGLDGLRAIAVITVILFHLTPGAMPGGYLGVDIFFVISGFLITALLIRERDKTGRIRLLEFWRRRARRLLPALVLLVLVSCSVALLAGGNVLIGLGRQVLGAATFSSNWLSIAAGSSYFSESNPELFRNLWSLAVEEQFYLVWPVAIVALLFVRSTTIRCLVVGILAIGAALAMALIYVPGGDATRVYYGTDTHSFGLAIGAVLALVSRQWWPSPLEWPRWLRVALSTAGAIAVACLIAASLTLPADSDLTYQGGLAAVAVLSAVAIAGATMPGSLLGRLLDAGPLRWVGERSYGLYLWHWPVFVLTVALLPGFALVGPSAWALGGIALVITVLASALSYRYLEQPIRRNGFRASLRAALSTWSNRQRWTRPNGWRRAVPRMALGMLALSLVAGTVVATGFSLTQDPGATDAQVFIEAGQSIAAPPHVFSPPPIAEKHVPAVIPGGDQITAIGDSVMLASAPELVRAFPGISIDATVSRQLRQAPDIVAALKAAGSLRPTLLLGLGTNGPIDSAVLDRVRQIVGPEHQIVVVNVQAPRWWTPGVNTALSAFAVQYRNVELANWQSAIQGNIKTLARDQIHPGDAGGAIYASTVRDALQRLAELPPVLSAKEYGLAPHPS